MHFFLFKFAENCTRHWKCCQSFLLRACDCVCVWGLSHTPTHTHQLTPTIHTQTHGNSATTKTVYSPLVKSIKIKRNQAKGSHKNSGKSINYTRLICIFQKFSIVTSNLQRMSRILSTCLATIFPFLRGIFITALCFRNRKDIPGITIFDLHLLVALLDRGRERGRRCPLGNITYQVSRLLNFLVTTLPRSMPRRSTIRWARSGCEVPENTLMFGILEWIKFRQPACFSKLSRIKLLARIGLAERTGITQSASRSFYYKFFSQRQQTAGSDVAALSVCQGVRATLCPCASVYGSVRTRESDSAAKSSNGACKPQRFALFLGIPHSISFIAAAFQCVCVSAPFSGSPSFLTQNKSHPIPDHVIFTNFLYGTKKLSNL